MDITYFFNVKQKCISDDTTYALMSQKYSPANETEFMDNKEEVKEIDNWFKNSTSGGLFIYGKPGSGKSCLIDIFCKKYNLNKFIQTSTNKRKKEILDLYNSIKHFTYNGIFVIDELETSLQRSDNVSISDLSNLISDSTIRIVFIAQSLYINKMTSLMNACVSVELKYPCFDTLFNRCYSIMQMEKIETSDTAIKNLKQMIECEMCEPRCVINSLHLLTISPEKITGRDRDLDLYKAYDVILNPNTNITNKLNAFLMDTGTTPILFQENYLNFKNDKFEKLDMCESMSIADIIHKRLFNITCRYAVEIYGIFATTFINIIKPTKKPAFGLLWTKLSAMYQKRKYIRNMEEALSFGKLNIVFLCNMNDIYKNYFNKWASKVKNKRKVDVNLQHEQTVKDFYNFMKYYNIYKNTSINYDLINSINFNKGKDFTKKTYCSYMDHFYDLMDTI